MVQEQANLLLALAKRLRGPFAFGDGIVREDPGFQAEGATIGR